MSADKNMVQVVTNEGKLQYAYSNELAMITQHGAVVKLFTPGIAKPTYAPQQKSGSEKWAPWGANDMFPQDMIKAVKSSTIIAPKLDLKARFLYSGGVVCGNVRYDDNGKETFIPIRNAEIERWKMASGFNRYLMEASKDLYWFYHVFPELSLDSTKRKVTRISVQAAENCRYEWASEVSGRIDVVYVNKNRAEGPNVGETKEIACLDAYNDPVGFMQADRRTNRNYIYPISYPVPGCEYYQIPEWNSVIESKWLSYSKLIPMFNEALMNNMLAVKYLIEIADWYWDWKYPGFSTVDEKQRATWIQNTLDEINTHLTGSDKAGKTVLATFKTDPVKGTEMRGIKITAIENKTLENLNLVDNGKMANEHLLYAIDFDPALAGATPGSERGSGSDIRVALNKHISFIKPHQDLILEPLYTIAEINGWNKFGTEGDILEWRFVNSMINTLNQGSETSKYIGTSKA